MHKKENDYDKTNLIQTIQNIKTFRTDQIIQEAIWALLNSFLTTKEENNNLIKAFQQLDVNMDGFIDVIIFPN